MNKNSIKPAIYFSLLEDLKIATRDRDWALVIHGSVNRDLDIILLPWGTFPCDEEEIIQTMLEVSGGELILGPIEKGNGRITYVINLFRLNKNNEDRQYYLDIAVFRP